MIIVMKPGTPDAEAKKVQESLEKQGFYINVSKGLNYCILGVVGIYYACFQFLG